MLRKIVTLGYNASLFGMHSFQAGGVIVAANARVQDRLFQRHGRWLSETAKDSYMKDSADIWLRVS